MSYRKPLGKNTVALLLFIAIMLPTTIQFIHFLDGHEHFACNDLSTHVHKSVDSCKSCSFHLASFNYDIAKYPDLELPIIPVKVNEDISSLRFHTFKITNTQLRAPPIYS